MQFTSMLHSPITGMHCRQLTYIVLLLTPFQSGYKGNPKLAAGILVRRLFIMIKAVWFVLTRV